MTRGRARQQQIGDVGASNQDDQTDGAEQNLKGRLRVTYGEILQWRHPCGKVAVRVGVLRGERAGDSGDLGVRLPW